MLVKGLPHEDFDDGLPANVELARRYVHFLKHVLCEVDVDSLYGRHHSTGVGELNSFYAEGGDPLPVFSGG